MVRVVNAQRMVRVECRRVERLARCAIRRLRLSESGQLAITFVSDQRMCSLNRRFLGHNRSTDVLSFRYDGEPVVGEILIAPSQARAYARAHGIAYEDELARYVVHGLLHWMGHDDRTVMQQQKMRMLEDQVLNGCGWLTMRGTGHGAGGRGERKSFRFSLAPRPSPLAPC